MQLCESGFESSAPGQCHAHRAEQDALVSMREQTLVRSTGSLSRCNDHSLTRRTSTGQVCPENVAAWGRGTHRDGAAPSPSRAATSTRSWLQHSAVMVLSRAADTKHQPCTECQGVTEAAAMTKQRPCGKHNSGQPPAAPVHDTKPRKAAAGAADPGACTVSSSCLSLERTGPTQPQSRGRLRDTC